MAATCSCPRRSADADATLAQRLDRLAFRRHRGDGGRGDARRARTVLHLRRSLGPAAPKAFGGVRTTAYDPAHDRGGAARSATRYRRLGTAGKIRRDLDISRFTVGAHPERP